VVTAFQPYLPGATMPGEVVDAATAQILLDSERETAAELAREGVKRVDRPGTPITSEAVEGRPAHAIVEVAARRSSDLVVVGTRGLGPFESALLGSVSAEIVEHARCPVLVARGTSIDRIVLADDGSPAARAAVSLLIDWPIFGRSRVRVISVAELHDRLVDRLRSSRHPTGQASGRVVETALAAATALAQQTAARLTASGLTADIDVRRGDPAHSLVDAAAEFGADLIVLGKRGLTGLEGTVVGSVARKVLHHAPCSVLVVHATKRDPATPGG
jgi:nucleotide-binding universal stress UspA family protein